MFSANFVAPLPVDAYNVVEKVAPGNNGYTGNFSHIAALESPVGRAESSTILSNERPRGDVLAESPLPTSIVAMISALAAPVVENQEDLLNFPTHDLPARDASDPQLISFASLSFVMRSLILDDDASFPKSGALVQTYVTT